MGSLIRRKFASVLALTLLPITFASPQQAAAVDGDGWCYVVGQVQGLDDRLECAYVPKGPTQRVYVATPYHWDVYLIRNTSYGIPEEVILATGEGVPAEPVTVSPPAGSTVYVRMFAGCLPPLGFPCGTKGVVGVGLEYGGRHEIAGIEFDLPPLTDGTSHTAGLCSIEATNRYSPALTGTAATRSVTSTGRLSDCVSDDVNGPASGTRSMGNVVTEGGPAGSPWTWLEPAGTLTGTCTSTTVTGTYIIRWDDGTRTVVRQTGSSNTWLIRATGEVIPSVTLTAVNRQPGQPETLTVSTTRFAGLDVAATKVSTVNPANPLECTGTGLTEAPRSGAYAFLAS